QERKPLLDPKIKGAAKDVAQADEQIRKMNQDYEDAKKKVEEAEASIKTLAGGADDRDNWHLLYRYIALALPRPDAANLVGEWKPKYYSEDAKKAFQKLMDKRYAKAAPEVAKDKDGKDKELPAKKLSDAEEEFIKKHLIQVNIEGIVPMYSEDLGPYFKKIAADSVDLLGMDEADKKRVRELVNAKDAEVPPEKAPPKKGWVVEIRGYTYHHNGAEFVNKTFLDNLRPDKAKLGELPEAEQAKIKKQ